LIDRQPAHVSCGTAFRRPCALSSHDTGKIERYHLTMKNIINLQNYYLPEELEREIAVFVGYYNHQRYHESLNNLTPADVYFGRAQEVLTRRQEIKQKTLEQRRLLHRQAAAV
jgi:putative transposase